jgi:hypothetical protein
MVITGMSGWRWRRRFAVSGAFDGEIAIAATPRVRRSSMIWISPASSALDAGPGVQAFVLGIRVLRLPFLAAQVDLLEERIVEPFDDDR